MTHFLENIIVKTNRALEDNISPCYQYKDDISSYYVQYYTYSLSPTN